ncbi:MAG: VWA domain-containing protein [Gammaproteobacteria bacterium]
MQGSIVTRFVLLASLLAVSPHSAFGQQASPVTQDIVVLLDNSGSMKKNDPLFVTKEAVRQFVSRTPPSGRLALLLFDQEARLIVPLSMMSNDQRARALSRLDRINYKGLFTNIPAAFEQALYELKTKGREDVPRSIILLTDGIVDTGDKGRDLERARWLREELAADAARQGVTVFGIGLGAKADIQLLQSLAQRTQGDYFRASKPDDLPAILIRIEKAVAQNLASRIDLKEAKTEQVTVATEKVTEPSKTARKIPDVKPIDLSPKSTQTTPLPPPVLKPQQSVKSLPDAKGWLPYLDLRTLGLGVAAFLLVALAFSLLTRHRRYTSSEKDTAIGLMSVERIPTAYFYDINGITDFERYELRGRVTQVGRIPPDQRETVEHIVIPLPTVGRRHAVLEYKHHSFWLVDQKSVNGTFVNGQRVFDEVCLKHGDRIRFHEAEFEFVQEGMDRADQTLLVTRVKGALAGPDTKYDHEPIVSKWVKDLMPDSATNSRPADQAQANAEGPAKQAFDKKSGHEFAEDLASKVRLATGESVAEMSPKKEALTGEIEPPDATEHMHADKIRKAMENTGEDRNSRSQAFPPTKDSSLSGMPDEETTTRKIKRKVTDEEGFEETLPSKRIAKNSWKDFFGE